MTPRVWNFNFDQDMPGDAVVIMRPGPWGNPFSLNQGYSRERAISTHRAWVMSQPDLIARIRRELRGRHLACCCKPKRCHGDFLLWLANLDPAI